MFSLVLGKRRLGEHGGLEVGDSFMRYSGSEIASFVRAEDALRKRYVEDSEFRSRVDSSPSSVLREALIESGFRVPDGVEIRAARGSSESLAFVMPSSPNRELSASHLTSASAAGDDPAGTASTVGTVGSAGTFPSCLGTVGTSGTAGSLKV
jgi:hypothetical protein